MSKITYVTAADVLNIHSVIIAETGGAHGVRDDHALLTLEELPKQAAFGKELYPTLFLKAALYVRNIITSHPFVDGNKRTSVTTADVFLQLNGYRVVVAEGGVEAFVLSVIEKHLKLEDIAAWLKKHSKKIQKKR